VRRLELETYKTSLVAHGSLASLRNSLETHNLELPKTAFKLLSRSDFIIVILLIVDQSKRKWEEDVVVAKPAVAARPVHAGINRLPTTV
jgi:hypothetical protein